MVIKFRYGIRMYMLIFRRYLSIVRDEGLEISQPALDPAKSVVYHQITARLRGSRVHRLVQNQFQYKYWNSLRYNCSLSIVTTILYVERLNEDLYCDYSKDVLILLVLLK